MTDAQIENLKWKFPDLLYTLIRDGRSNEICASMFVPPSTVLKYLEARDFPNEDQLMGFCTHFKLRYETLKTWNIQHLL